MLTRRNSGITGKEPAESAESTAPLRRSGRQTKRKLTKTESSELVHSSPTRGQKRNVGMTSPKDASPLAKQIKRNEPTAEGSAALSAITRKKTPATAADSSKTTLLSIKGTAQASGSKGSESILKEQVGIVVPASPKTNRATPRGRITLQSPSIATSKINSPKKEVQSLKAILTPKKEGASNSSDIPQPSNHPTLPQDSNATLSAKVMLSGTKKSQTSGVKAVRSSPRKFTTQEKINVGKEGNEGDESEEDELVISTEASSAQARSEAKGGKALTVDSDESKVNPLTVDNSKSEGKSNPHQVAEPTKESVPKASTSVVVQSAPLMTTTTVTDSEKEAVSVPMQEKADLHVVAVPESQQKKVDVKESRPRRKRVASELLQAAEIAHGLLDNKPRVPTQTGESSMTTNSKTDSVAGLKAGSNMRSILPAKGQPAVPGQPKAAEIIIKPQTHLTTAAGRVEETNLENDPLSAYDTPKLNVVFEKQEDSIFESVTAIVKTSFIARQPQKDFVLHQLPKLTGVSAVVSPSSHYLLHGSWLSVIRARNALEKYMTSAERATHHSSKNKQSSQPDFPALDDDSVDNSLFDSVDLPRNEQDAGKQSVTSEAGAVNAPDSSVVVMAPDDPNAVALNVMVETERSEGSVSDDLTDDCSIPPVSDYLDLKDDSRVAGRVQGLDRTKLSGSVEVYKGDNQGPMFLCSVCGFASRQQHYVQTHINRKHGEKMFKCGFCSKTFNVKRDLERHTNIVHVQEAKYKCELCDKTFTDKRYLSTHIKRHTGVKNHQCTICGRKFFERHKLKWHLETHKSTEEKNLPYSCPICHRKFYNRSSLADHQNIHTGARPFECNQCEASFSHRIGLKRHLMVHTDERRFVCECGKAFKTARQFEMHKVQHTGIGKHTCRYCLKVFSSPFSLKRHTQQCAKKEEEEESTERVTETEVAMEHIQDDTHQVEPGDSDTVFMCGVCDRLFSSLEETAAHTRTHTSSEMDRSGMEQTQGEAMENYTITLQNTDGEGVQDSLVYVPQEDGGIASEETAVKLLTAMTASQGYVLEDAGRQMDDTHLVANTLADLSALAQT